MDDQTTSPPEENIPQLPPPETLPPVPPLLSDRADFRRRLYLIWCTVTVSAALFALLLVGIQSVRELGGNHGEALRRLVLQRVLGAGGGDNEDSLIELMLGQVLAPRGLGELAVSVEPTPPHPPETTAPPVAETTAPQTVSPPPDLYAYDPTAVPAGEHPILPLDLSLIEYGAEYISNETAYTPDIAALLEADNILPPFDHTASAVYPPGEPVVLILHTHATEAYSPDGAISYPDAADYARSSDPTENVVAVGARMAEVLRKSGVPTLHCTILHDELSYRDSYVRAAETIRRYLAEYPSIQYVFDVHRDALIRGDDELVRPVTAVAGEAVAQVMILAGSDYKGAVFPDWEGNLAFALQLRERLNEKYERLARPVYLRGAAFNEHYSARSLLLEIGASGNSLAEALRAGELVARTLADMIKAAD